MNIDSWMKKFKESWESKDVLGVLSLFEEDVEYYETPFRKLRDFSEVRAEWMAIKKHFDIELNYEVFSSAGGKYSVIWDLKYINIDNEKKYFGGTYLIILNAKNKCTFFHHSCQ